MTDYGSVYCCRRGDHFTFSSLDLHGSVGITSDPSGNVFVVGRGSYNVHRLSQDGKSSEIVLSEKDKIRGPMAMVFSKGYQKPFLSNQGGREIWIYNYNVEY